MRKIVQNITQQVYRQQKGAKTLSQQAIKYSFISSKQSQKLASKNFTKFQTFPAYYFGKATHNVPEIADSISEGTVLELKKKVGDYIFQDEILAILETDKVEFEIKSPSSGAITQLFAAEQDTVEVGKPFFEIDDSAAAPEGAKPAASSDSAPAADAPAAAAPQAAAPQQAQQTYTPPPTTQAAAPAAKAPAQTQAPPPPQVPLTPPTQLRPPPSVVTRGERREPLSRMRQKISERLKDSQNTYALLTTFQECDMSAVMEIRNKYQKDFQKKHNVKLGFMSFFIKAATHGLQNQPIINAVIDGKEVVYRDYIDVSVAVATPNGLMVPVLRNCENQSFSDLEKNLIYLAEKGKQGKISLEDMAGGTFTISNGGVFGSMMGTPILNPPQSAILGMHSIINRPVVRNDKIVARPMMYLALTYDHRLIDGREAATFLKQLANEIEDPRRILLDL